MPSPFPGMDPWLESPGLFPDLHQRLIAYLSEAVSVTLPRPYYTAIGTRLYVEESDRRIEPDVDVLVSRKHPKRSEPVGSTAVLGKAKPLLIRPVSDPIREWSLEIRHAESGDRLVTSVEVLSLSNKAYRSEGRRMYRKKQRELVRSRVNIVEIDLLRSGEHTTLAPLERAVEEVGPFEYHACTRRYYRTSAREVYPIRMEDRLPLIAIPLLKGDADITVDLQPVFDKSYDIARFNQRAAYAKPTQPPLTTVQLAWAEGLLKEKGLV